MPTEIAKWITDIGAEMRLRSQFPPLDGRSQRIEELLKSIADREVATGYELASSNMIGSTSGVDPH